MRVNVDEASGHARLVMRQKGNLRLLLNANLWAEMQLTMMEGGSVGFIFHCTFEWQLATIECNSEFGGCCLISLSL